MNAATNVEKVVGCQRTNNAVSEGTREAQNAFLSEFPGAVFAFITMAYVISPLISLADEQPRW